MVVLVTEPAVGVMVNVEAKPLPEVNETSNPLGALTKRSLVKFDALTLNVVSADGDP